MDIALKIKIRMLKRAQGTQIFMRVRGPLLAASCLSVVFEQNQRLTVSSGREADCHDFFLIPKPR